MRDDGCPALGARQLDTVERFGERADLIDLDEDGVGDAKLDALLQKFRVGDEEIVADELHAAAYLVRQNLPAVPIVFGHAVFNRDDRILLGPALPEGYHLVA